MRTFLLGSSLIIGLVLQSTLFEKLQIVGAKPDLLLIVVVLIGILQGREQGAKVGFIFGLVEDLYLGRYWGLNAFVKMLTGYLVGLAENKVFKENLLIPSFGLFSATFLHNFIYIALAGLAGLGTEVVPYVWHVTFPMASYNAIIATLIYGRFYRSATKGYLKVSRYK